MNQKFAIFDIDKTVIHTDSMFRFLKYGIRKHPATTPVILKVVLHSVLYKLRLLEAEKAKSAYFHAMRHMDDADLKHFYETELKPAIFPDALKEMQLKKSEGYHVLLVTASPDAYMRYFAELPCVDAVIATKLSVRDGRFTSMIEGNNCKGEEKVNRIQQYLSEQRLAIDYDSSCAYSDSLSDLPMFRLVKHKYLINQKSAHGCEGLTWNK
ncbi:HAD family hydrolase [Paenibacillus lautus]|uniref:HAD family hydrolase n=1 Tax=Paenibacillus lautus TaxID=1401 RepID=UPI000BBD7438|nr:HAD family hydrolase [Paenibacillus lautus]PCL93897.1 HAD-IB family hydrolase [Paenibacillus lautus]GIP04062.1 phosphoserine phosphatase [Paenibacillus lautus]